MGMGMMLVYYFFKYNVLNTGVYMMIMYVHIHEASHTCTCVAHKCTTVHTYIHTFTTHAHMYCVYTKIHFSFQNFPYKIYIMYVITQGITFQVSIEIQQNFDKQRHINPKSSHHIKIY